MAGAPSRIVLAGTLALVGLAGCELYSSTGDGREVAGISFFDLFHAPSVEELDAIEADWAARSVQAVNVRIQAQFTVNASTLYIVTHDVNGVRHAGAILVPNSAAPSSLPVLVYAHGGDGGVAIDDELLAVLSLVEPLANNYVFVAPSFRSESIRYQGQAWISEGPPSPWDYDVDDALALLSTVPVITAAADMSSVGVLGFSRGAGVALLMGIRDPRIDVIVDFFGPTDFFGPFVQDVVEEALLGSPRDLPGLDYMNETYIQPLKNGVLTIDDVRPELVRRSAVLFADRLPALQMHHGSADTTVPVSQATSLIGAMERMGRTAPGFESYIYENGQHNPFTLPGSLDRSVTFLSRNLGI